MYIKIVRSVILAVYIYIYLDLDGKKNYVLSSTYYELLEKKPKKTSY